MQYNVLRIFSITVFIFFILLISPPLATTAQLKLAWDPNTEADLAGYKIYFGTASRVYGTPIDIGSMTTCLLSGLVRGQTYYVAVTAYDRIYNESAYSAEVTGVANDSTPGYVLTKIDTSPTGLHLIVDQTTYTAPYSFSWSPGSVHNLSVPSPQAGASGLRQIFASWSDGGAQTHSITTPSASTNYTANLTSEYSLTVSANPAGGGTVTPSATAWYRGGQTVSVTATPKTGYRFTGWSGDISTTANPSSLTMNGPKSVTANFTSAVTQQGCTVTTNPSGLQITVDGSTYTAPRTFSWTVGSSHTISVPSPQAGTSGVRQTFVSWSDGGVQTHSITTRTSTTTYTANLTPEYSLTLSSTPPAGGTLSLPSTGWYRSGQVLAISAAPNPGFQFTGWSGDISSRANPSSLTMNGPKSVTANFTSAVTQQGYTVTTNPSGLQIVVDGSTYTAPRTFTWTVGSSHTISAPSPQAGASGVLQTFVSWSDSGAQTHSITTPASATAYTANLIPKYSLTLSSNPPAAGVLSLPSTGWYRSGQAVPVSAAPNPGFQFTGWSGDFSSTLNPSVILMDVAKNVVANFSSIGNRPNLIGTWSTAVALNCGTSTCSLSGAFTVRNIGQATAPSAPVFFYLSKDNTLGGSAILLDTGRTGKLAPGGSVVVQLASMVLNRQSFDGRYIIGVIDRFNLTPETNESNTIAVGPLSVTLN
jgi:uncharacterized repeat protein (TIGR02543 family)